MLRTAVNILMFAWAALFLLLGFAAAHAVSASWWLEVRSVRVFDAQAGAPVLMAVDRSIERDFYGDWSVSIRRWDAGGWVSYCQARGQANYATDSQLPDPLTLQWWTHPGCHPLPPGRYVMRTSWTVHPDMSVLPAKRVQADSNIFEVRP